MKLLEGVQTYVEGKRSGGTGYAKGIQSLASFCRHAGDVTLNSISERQVASFLEGPRTSTITWRNKYNLLRSFFFSGWHATQCPRADASSTPACCDDVCSSHLLSD